MQKFDILDPHLNVFQSRFLEASAGTGKTFAIEHLVCRLLLESEEPILLSEILAVTFTKDAANEMKTRIRRKLETLLPQGGRRLHEALTNMDDLQIFTIHGFCHRMLTEFAFEAGAPLRMSSPDRPDHLTEMAQVVQDFFRTGSKEFEPEISALLKKMRYDIDRAINTIVSAMSRFTHQDKIAKECFERWQIKAARSDHFTFDDLLKKMESALSSEPFLEKVRAKYKVVIVDEFQDTDPTQWRIFEKLFLHTDHLIYLVGDPKQSIYGFRNADIYTYMKAAHLLGQERKAYLDTNFRSSPQLIEKLNDLFTEKPQWISLPSLPQGLHYHPVKAGRVEAKLHEPPIHYFGVKGSQGREKSWPTKTMEEEKLFPFIASEMARLHQEEQIPFSQMAVLIKDRFQGKRLQLHLNQWKIPSHIKQTFNLTESRGFAALEMLLKAIAHPEKESFVRAVLYGPLMHLEENPFFAFKELFQEKGFAPFFAEFMSKHFNAHDDPSLYLEMRQTAGILMQQGAVQIEDHLHLLEELKRSSPEIDERLRLRGEEGDLAPLMTTFGSKGLEFEVVFALGLASRYQEEREDPEKQAEKMRQLYVAFTRSREKLYIPILHDEAQKPVASGCESPIELFFANRKVNVEWIGNIAIKPLNEKIGGIDLIPPPKPHLHFDPEYLTSFTAMSKSQGLILVPLESWSFALAIGAPSHPTRPASSFSIVSWAGSDANLPPLASANSPTFNCRQYTLLAEQYQSQDLKIKTPHTLPIGAETGVVIHTIFETAFQNRSTPLSQIVLEILTGTHLEGWEEVIEKMVQDIFKMPLIGDFTLDSLTEGDYFQEMEFLFPTEKELVKGFIDLVFVHNDHFYIVDWKTNWLGPSEEAYTDEKLHQVMLEHDYFLQAKLYQEALDRYVKRFYKTPQFGGAYYIFVRGKKGVHIGNS